MSNWRYKPPPGSRVDKQIQLAQGLVGCWLFNEGAGRVANDISGYGNHGTLAGMVNPPTATSGWGGGGLQFDGSDDYVNIADTPTLSFGNSAEDTAFSLVGSVYCTDNTDWPSDQADFDINDLPLICALAMSTDAEDEDRAKNFVYEG